VRFFRDAVEYYIPREGPYDCSVVLQSSDFVPRWTLFKNKDFLLPVGLLLSYSVLRWRIRIAKCFTKSSTNDFNAKQCSSVGARSTREYTMFAPSLLLRSGLATRTNLIRVSWGWLEESVIWDWPASDLIFTVVSDCFGLRCKVFTLYHRAITPANRCYYIL